MRSLYKVVPILAMFTALSVSYAQQDNLIPPNLLVITPDNIDQVDEIASIGNGGAGYLYWSPDGKTLVMNNSYGIWLHDTESLNDEPRFIPEPDLDLLHFSDDGSLIVTWSAQHDMDAPARAWDVDNTERVSRWGETDISDNPGWRYQFDVIEAGPMVDRHYLVTFWDIITDTVLYSYRSHPNNLYFSRDRSIAAIGDRNSLTFDVATGEPIWVYNDGTTYASASFQQISSSGDFILVRAAEGLVTLHRSSDGEVVRSLEAAGDDDWGYIGFTPDDRYIVARNSPDNLIQIWETQTGEIANTFALDGRFTGAAQSEMTLVKDSLLMAVLSRSGYIAFYNLQSGQEVGRILAEETLFDYAYSPDGCCVATISIEGVLRVWDAESGEQLFQSDRYQAVGEVTAISPDGKLLITVVTNSRETGAILRIWDIQSGQIINELEQAYSRYPIVRFSLMVNSLPPTRWGRIP